MGIGVPFNIASYALLTRMIAHITNLEPGELIHTMGDCHIYNNHIEAIQRQLTREPRPFPKLRINISDAATIREIDDFRAEHFELMDYKPHEKIFLEMAI